VDELQTPGSLRLLIFCQLADGEICNASEIAQSLETAFQVCLP
jgi:hypothetical protein